VLCISLMQLVCGGPAPTEDGKSDKAEEEDQENNNHL